MIAGNTRAAAETQPQQGPAPTLPEIASDKISADSLLLAQTTILNRYTTYQGGELLRQIKSQLVIHGVALNSPCEGSDWRLLDTTTLLNRKEQDKQLSAMSEEPRKLYLHGMLTQLILEFGPILPSPGTPRLTLDEIAHLMPIFCEATLLQHHDLQPKILTHASPALRKLMLLALNSQLGSVMAPAANQAAHVLVNFYMDTISDRLRFSEEVSIDR